MMGLGRKPKMEPEISVYWDPNQETLRKYMVKMEGWRQWDASLSTAEQIIRDLKTLPVENITDNNINLQHLIRLIGTKEAYRQLGGSPSPPSPPSPPIAINKEHPQLELF